MNSDALIGEKRIIERSASYPGISLSDAIQFGSEISRSFPTTQAFSREDVAAVLNKSTASIVREVAACAQFGLFTKDKEGYKISPLLKKIQNFLNENEKRESLIEAFNSPKLYSELIEKFNGHVILKELKTHLIRFHKIAEKVAQLTADIFIESGIFAGVISPRTNILNLKGEVVRNYESETETNITGNSKDFTTSLPDENGENDFKEDKKEQLLIPEMVNEEKTKIRLTENKFCFLVYPRNINKKDVMIIRKQVEMLEILTE